VLLLVLAAAGCADDTEPEPAVVVAPDVVADRATAAVESVTTMRADVSLISSYDDLPAVVARAEAAIDLGAGIATLDTSISLEPGADGGEEQSQEIVVVGDRAYRRDPGEEWESSGDTLVEVALAAFEEDGSDMAAAVTRIVLAAPAPWIATTDGGVTTYVSADETSGAVVEVDIDDDGHLTRLVRSQPPFGADVDDLRRVGAETVFTGFDSTTVEIPADLPPG